MHWLAVDPESWAQSESPVHLMPVREDHYVHPAALLHPHHRAGEAGLHILHHQPGLGRRSEEHTSELQSRGHLVCRLLLEKKERMARMVGNCRRYSSMLNCARSTEAKGGQCTRLS